MSTSAPKRLLQEEQPSKGPIVAAVAVTVAFVLAVGGYFGFCAWVKNNDRLLPGTAVTGLPGGAVVDLGGMDRQEAAALLEGRLGQDLESRSLTVDYGEESAVLDGELLCTDAQVPVDRALEDKRARPLYTLGAAWLGLGGESRQDVSALALTEDGQRKVDALAAQIAQAMYIPPVEDSYEIGEKSVELTRGSDGQEVDREALAQEMTDALIAGQERLEVVPVPLTAEPLTGEKISRLVYTEPQPLQRAEDGSITPPVSGRSVDAAQVQDTLDVLAPGESGSVPITLTHPDFGDESKLYQDVLSQSVTYMAGTSNRRTNIRLAAEAVNGAIVLPGEVFSYNQTVGERTAAKGYKTATVYVGGADKQELGGGICQLASAIYYCTLYADLEIVERVNHRFAVTYVPYGLDATVAWPTLDYKFRNNASYPIKIVTSTDKKNNLTVTLYGTKENDHYVEMKTKQLSKTPYNTVYTIDNALGPGETRDDVHAYTGYKYESYRCVYDGTGKQLSRTFEASSTYSYRDKVVAVSPYDAASYGLEGGISTPPPAVTDPAIPSLPVEPTYPVDPSQPVDPTYPVEPTYPVGPTQPVDPTYPLDPTQEPTAFPEPSPTFDPWVPEPTQDPEPVDPDPNPTPDNAIPNWPVP